MKALATSRVPLTAADKAFSWSVSLPRSHPYNILQFSPHRYCPLKRTNGSACNWQHAETGATPSIPTPTAMQLSDRDCKYVWSLNSDQLNQAAKAFWHLTLWVVQVLFGITRTLSDPVVPLDLHEVPSRAEPVQVAKGHFLHSYGLYS